MTRREMLAASAGAIVLGAVPTTGAAAAEEPRTAPGLLSLSLRRDTGNSSSTMAVQRSARVSTSWNWLCSMN